MRNALIFFVLLLASGEALADSLYVIYGPRGSVTFTTRRPKQGERYRVIKPREARYSKLRRRGRMNWRAYPIESEFDPLIASAAQAFQLDPALVKAVVHAESAFNPKARSHKGAMGLMQLMPATARRFGVENAYHPEQNVRGGSEYLRWLLSRYGGNVRLALAAYNAGENAVDKRNAIPPYRETQEYVRRVLKLFKVYRSQLHAAS